MSGRETGQEIDAEIARIRRRRFRSLSFGRSLEERFERETAEERSYRLWLEGFLAILALNGCLVADYFLVKDVHWETVVLRTMVVTPLALLVNSVTRRNPTGWIREGIVASGTTVIGLILMFVEGNATASTTAFGLMCVLITILFVGAVMRVRFSYAAVATAVMSAGELWYLSRASGLPISEKVIGASLLVIGVAFTMTATYSLEREERLGYLLFVRSEMQGRELAGANTELKRLSVMDTLTGLPNRRAFEEQFERYWVESQRTRSPLCAIVVDVDHFKILNDVYGHLYGDKVLQRIASLLPQGLRGLEDFTARFGGEEFVILMPDTELDQAGVAAERIRGLVEVAGTPILEQQGGDPVLWVTISCGVAMCVPGSGIHRDDLLEAADRALYKAKAGGRNRVSQRMVEQGAGGLRSLGQEGRRGSAAECGAVIGRVWVERGIYSSREQDFLYRDVWLPDECARLREGDRDAGAAGICAGGG